ncbi:MAG: hypothetical protein ICV68_15840 [Pyrinomonadaceae bacterium]|nr:hypothetical protein [Pyrinomonadaceae bacterium]
MGSLPNPPEQNHAKGEDPPPSSLEELQVKPEDRAFMGMLAELDELFGLEQTAYGESYMERLWEDEELSTKIRERFERGKASEKFPALSDFLSNLSTKEKEVFFKTGGEQAIRHRRLVPEDVGVRFRQLQELLRGEPEFHTRYPEASDILLPNRARRMERGGLPLPSFGVRIPRYEPRYHAHTSEEPIGSALGGDAYSATYVPKFEMGIHQWIKASGP